MIDLHLKKIAKFAIIIAFAFSCQKTNLQPSSVKVQYGSNPKINVNTVGASNWIAHISHGKWNCSGFLITPSLVMTAAHCVTDSSGKKISETIYVTFPGKFSMTVPGQLHSIHPKYTSNHNITAERYLLNDFAVLKLKEPVKAQIILNNIPVILTDSVQVRAAIGPRKQVLFFGYGKQDGTSTEKVLTYGSGAPIPKEVCFNALTPRFVIKCLNKEVEKFCVAADGTEARIIHGDSGGPVTQYINGRHQVLGITSHYFKDPSNLSFFETFDTPSVKAWLAQVLANP